MLAFIISLILLIFIGLQFSLEETNETSLDTLRSVEAGFEKSLHEGIICVPFFYIIVLYVLFDLELVILFPFIFSGQATILRALRALRIVYVILITLFVE